MLELGVGTGRIALPLVDAGLDVVGIDASRRCLMRCAAKTDARRVHAVLGDMAELPFAATFSLVLVAFNTLFNLAATIASRRASPKSPACSHPHGVFVVEAFVPPLPGEAADDGVSVREIRDDAVVLTAATRTHHDHLITGSHIEIGPAGVRLAAVAALLRDTRRARRLRHAVPASSWRRATAAGTVSRTTTNRPRM